MGALWISSFLIHIILSFFLNLKGDASGPSISPNSPPSTNPNLPKGNVQCLHPQHFSNCQTRTKLRIPNCFFDPKLFLMSRIFFATFFWTQKFISTYFFFNTKILFNLFFLPLKKISTHKPKMVGEEKLHIFPLFWCFMRIFDYSVTKNA